VILDSTINGTKPLIPTYDIESMNFTDPIAIGFFDGVDYHEFLKYTEDGDVVQDFLDFLSKDYVGLKLFAHNAVNYDNKYILDGLYKRRQKIGFTAGIARLQWKEQKIYFEDSMLILGRNLRACCEAFGVDQKLSWDHRKTRNIWEMDKLDEFRAYMKRDVIGLSEVMTKYCKVLLTEFNVTPSMTMPLTAAKAFDKVFYPVKKIDSNEEHELFIRKATVGGRNEVYRRQGEGIYFYDINKMYLSCYDVPVPIGRMRWTKPNIDSGTLAEAIVKVPQRMIAPLPFNLPIDRGFESRLIFPVGEFRSWWDIRELRNAVRLGCDVDIKRQIEGDESPILDAFGDKVWDLIGSSNKELARIWKLFGVRLCGKFGQHRRQLEIAHAADIQDQDGWAPIDDEEVYHEKIVERKGHRTPYIKPAINMRIRAEARIRHLELLLSAASKGDVFYCDNDSVVTNALMYKGTQRGELKLLDHAVEAWFVRCKFYGYVDDRGFLKTRMAGFHEFDITSYDFKRLVSGDIKSLRNTFKGMTPWKDAFSGGGVHMVDRSRTINGEREFENRIINGLDTEPIRLEMINGRISHVKPPYYSLT